MKDAWAGFKTQSAPVHMPIESNTTANTTIAAKEAYCYSINNLVSMSRTHSQTHRDLDLRSAIFKCEFLGNCENERKNGSYNT